MAQLKAMELHKFDERLRALTAENSRPFLCEGSPLECTVFLVGLNPRTQTSFWPHWDASYGCRKASWLEDYARNHGGKFGRTRKYIEILFESLTPFKCLETNVFSVWSNRIADLPVEHRTTQVFDFLLNTIKPRLVFVHGRKAISHVERLTQRTLPRNEVIRSVEFGGSDADVYLRHHLSYQLSEIECRRIGDRLRDHMMGKQI